MESFKFETKYEDEPMDVNETPSMGYYEEGEINSSDGEKNMEVQMPLSAPSIFVRNSHQDKTIGFVSGFCVFNKDEAQKRLDRAKRFSLQVETATVEELNQEILSNLYRELGVDKENERHYRFNTLHMRGTENMSTDDVMQYFDSYAPSHVEWINDVSCNIVWLDDVSAARALLNLSRKIKNLNKVHLSADPFAKDFKNDDYSKEVNDNDDHEDSAVDAKELKVAIPPGLWRIGVPCKKNSSLLLRLATRSDKKQKNSEKNSEYYKKYGNPHYGNIPGLISNSFRYGMKKSKTTRSDIISNTNKYIKKESGKNNPWEELAYEWGKTDTVEDTDQKYLMSNIFQRRTEIPDLRLSLTNKKVRARKIKEDFKISAESYSDKRIWNNKNKIPRMKMYADDEDKRQEKNLQKKFQSRSLKRCAEEDLRSKISRKKSKLRLKFRPEKKIQYMPSGEFSVSENEYEDEESNDWALEYYHDLRESLEQNKRKKGLRYNILKYEPESEDDDYMDDKLYKNINQRSPLQIEIENDEYYLNKDL